MLIAKRHGGSVPKLLESHTPAQRLADFQEEIRFKVLHRSHQAPEVSQRIPAQELGISLGSINAGF
ncbi:MAG: hypothetical protein BGO63_08670 [Candidatus Accumulibacter sp. 66-26]|nr:hypothetical protein [Accumulibacter sp.]OJW49342.1 MAG: hypothetical protein BGO63_08670 [Candidatus Accumulibacter sp. 66-26]